MRLNIGDYWRLVITTSSFPVWLDCRRYINGHRWQIAIVLHCLKWSIVVWNGSARNQFKKKGRGTAGIVRHDVIHNHATIGSCDKLAYSYKSNLLERVATPRTKRLCIWYNRITTTFGAAQQANAIHTQRSSSHVGHPFLYKVDFY